MDNPNPENHPTHIYNFNDDWEHVQIRSSSSSDEHLSIFPTSLHQDPAIINTTLPLSTTHYYDQDPTSPASSANSSQTSDSEPNAWILSLICGRLGIRLTSSKVANLAAKLYSFVGLWKAGIVSVLFLTFIWVESHRRRRQRVAEEDASRLKKLMKEKDRVIDKLLLEIAQMNEELSGRRSVPVYRIR